MNTTTMIRPFGLVLGLVLPACLSPHPVREPPGLGDEGTGLELPGNITTVGLERVGIIGHKFEVARKYPTRHADVEPCSRHVLPMVDAS